MTPPSLFLSKMFGEDNWESDDIYWESMVGNRGMTPFVAPGAPAPRVVPSGVGTHRAHAAFWKEKMYFDESFLNNIREPGTLETYWPAKRMLARQTKMIRNRCDRRKEWMIAKMLADGSFSYLEKNGIKVSVDYGIPTANQNSLAANRLWSTGTSRNIVEDIMDAKIAVSNDIGVELNYAMFTTEVLKYMLLDSSIQTLLQKSAFGNGDLFANPTRVLGTLLGIGNMMQYDEQYQIRAWLTSAVAAGDDPTISVNDPLDLCLLFQPYVHHKLTLAVF